jgi:hypothetical protein
MLLLTEREGKMVAVIGYKNAGPNLEGAVFSLHGGQEDDIERGHQHNLATIAAVHAEAVEDEA